MDANIECIQDNIILQKKHFLMQIMINGNEVKKRTEAETYDDKLPLRRLKEIETIWNYTFINLIREGLQYDYIKHPTDEKKDIIRLTIDNVQYDCLATDLKKILGNDYPNVINDEHIVNNNANIDIKSDVHIDTKNDSNIETITKEAKENENTDDSRKTTPTIDKDKNKVINFDVTSTNDSKEKQNDIISQIQYEMYKNINTFIYDIYELEVLPPGGKQGSIIKAIIAPLTIAENDVHPDIAVLLMNSRGQIETFCSNKTSAALKITFDGNDFLIRGAFADGDFQSHIILTGNTLSMGFNLNIKNQINQRSTNKEKTNYGHICFEKKGLVYHIIPISLKNDENEIAHCLLCVESKEDINSDKFFRDTLTTDIDSSLIYHKNGILHNVLVYWKEDILCADVID